MLAANLKSKIKKLSQKNKRKKEKKMPSKKSLKESGKGNKTVKQVTASSGDRRRRKRKETFSLYIYKVLKQVHPSKGISKKAMNIMNSMVNDIFEQICVLSAQLIRYNKKKTLTTKEIFACAKLLLPGELANHAVAEGVRAVNKYNMS